MADIVLHHFGMSGSSQKLRLVLEEKGLIWTGRIIDLLHGEQHSPAYRAINPDGFVPALVHGARVFTQVSATAEYLDEVFPDPPLRPSTAADRHEMRCWVKRVDESVHPANGFLSYAIAGRPALRALDAGAREAYLAAMPNPRDRRLRRIAIEHGIEAPEFVEAIHAHLDLMARMEAVLQGRAHLAGKMLSFADLTALPYLCRLEHLGIGCVLAPERFPAVAQWRARMMARPSYDAAISLFLPSNLADTRAASNGTAARAREILTAWKP